ncbi:MAG: aromatic ring-hydroxylating dioxygenase subunit alpha [bacterium]|nr:aromatic ring-hydroxylating dioxygenase subunit alpha [bacterium]
MGAAPVVDIDPAVRDLWHPVAALEELRPGWTMRTQLLDQRIAVTLGADGDPAARLEAADRPAPGGGADVGAAAEDLPTMAAYEFAWTSLGAPPAGLFAIPECDEPDRRNLSAGTIGVRVSAPRAVENFLDMGHFPYVHAGILGQAPRTEVLEYVVEVDSASNELFARDCEFFQPYAAAAAGGGQQSKYTYRVPHPYCVMLYKSCPVDSSRLDVIALFVQSLSCDRVRAHNFMSLIDDQSTDGELRRFQQHIFGQDKPILENQTPRLLPLDPADEHSVRADRSSVTYRRWLSRLGVTYGVIPERSHDDDF